MARPRPAIPTPAETRALRFMHEHGSATVREYLEQGSHAQEPAYTSVMSLLSVLYEKGLATRKQEKRAFRYTPTMSQAELRSSVLANVLESVFGGSVEELRSTLGEIEKTTKRKKKATAD
jgi:BlaI family transcriptional regulator, penicillinase repressor